MDIPARPAHEAALSPAARGAGARLADRAAGVRGERTVRHAEAVVPVGLGVLAAAGTYGAIARQVATEGEHGWDHRISTVGRGQDRLHRPRLARAMQRRFLYPPAPRDPALWTKAAHRQRQINLIR